MPSPNSALFSLIVKESGVIKSAVLFGISPGYVSQIRNGKRIPSLRLALRLAKLDPRLSPDGWVNAEPGTPVDA